MRRVVLPCLTAGLAVLACAGTAGAVERERSAPAGSGYVPGEVLVRFKPGVDGSERSAARRKQDATVKDALEVPRVQLLDIEPGTSVREAVAAFERDPRVEYAEPNHRVSATLAPDDPDFSLMWGLHNLDDLLGTPDADIDAPEAWDLITGDPNVTVGVVDTGVSAAHPDLVNRLLPGRDFIQEDGAPGDLDGHGTHVAGTIGAEGGNFQGVTGVAWDVRLMPLRVLGADGSGTFADVAEAFAYAGNQGVPIVNASLGGVPSSGEINTLTTAIQDASATLFVVAAGNEKADVDAEPHYPCALPLDNVLCVAASDREDAPASFTNYGASSVDIAAPGVGIRSTEPVRSVLWEETFEVDDLSASWNEGSVIAGVDVDQDTAWQRSDAAGDQSQGAWGLVDSPGNYANNSDTYVRRTVPAALTTDCKAVFDLRLDLAGSADRFSLEASESATGPWEEVYGRSTDTITGHSGFDPDEDGFWEIHADLRADDGSFDFYGKTVYLRFRLKSNGSGNAAGAAVDWVEIVCYGGEDYGSMSGTSMAAPHVAGAAALVLAQSIDQGDPLTVSELKARLLDTGDMLPCWEGLTLTESRLNLARALGVSSGLGAGGTDCPITITREESTPPPPPPPPEPPSVPPPPPEPPSGTGSTTPAPSAPPPAPPAVDDDPPRVRASAARRYRASTLLRRGLRARLRCDEACRVRADVLVGRRTAKRYGIRGRRFGSRYILVGRERESLSRAGSEVVTTRISRRARRGLRRAKRVRLVLRVLASDEHRNHRVTRRSLTVRR